MLKTIAEQWSEFEKTVLDPMGAGPTQRQEMRRAFYAGVSFMLDQNLAIGDDGVDEDDGVKHLASIHAELDVFYLKLKTGVPGY